MAARKPGGRIVNKAQPELPPPTETRRLRDAAVAGMRAAEWASQLGRLYLAGQIGSLQYSAGRRWQALAIAYAEALGCPRGPDSAQLDRSGGAAPDPETQAGARIVRRHARTIEHYIGANSALVHAGKQAERVTRAVTEQDLAPCGWAETQALKSGLQHLAAYWATQGKTRR